MDPPVASTYERPHGLAVVPDHTIQVVARIGQLACIGHIRQSNLVAVASARVHSEQLGFVHVQEYCAQA